MAANYSKSSTVRCGWGRAAGIVRAGHRCVSLVWEDGRITANWMQRVDCEVVSLFWKELPACTTGTRFTKFSKGGMFRAYRLVVGVSVSGTRGGACLPKLRSNSRGPTVRDRSAVLVFLEERTARVLKKKRSKRDWNLVLFDVISEVDTDRTTWEILTITITSWVFTQFCLMGYLAFHLPFYWKSQLPKPLEKMTLSQTMYTFAGQTYGAPQTV